MLRCTPSQSAARVVSVSNCYQNWETPQGNVYIYLLAEADVLLTLITSPMEGPHANLSWLALIYLVSELLRFPIFLNALGHTMIMLYCVKWGGPWGMRPEGNPYPAELPTYYSLACIDRCYTNNALWMLTYRRCHNVFAILMFHVEFIRSYIHLSSYGYAYTCMFWLLCHTRFPTTYDDLYWVIHSVVGCRFFTRLDNVSIYYWIWQL